MIRLVTGASTCKLAGSPDSQSWRDRRHGLNRCATSLVPSDPTCITNDRTIQAIMEISLLSPNTSVQRLWIRALICWWCKSIPIWISWKKRLRNGSWRAEMQEIIMMVQAWFHLHLLVPKMRIVYSICYNMISLLSGTMNYTPTIPLDGYTIIKLSCKLHRQYSHTRRGNWWVVEEDIWLRMSRLRSMARWRSLVIDSLNSSRSSMS